MPENRGTDNAMRRGNSNSNGGRRTVGSRAPAPPLNNNNSALDTINAAANRIASFENHPAQATAAAASAQKRSWGGCWNIYLCFGYQRRRKQIGHAVIVPEAQTSGSGNGPSASVENHNQPTTFVFPFNAPPSSPASFLPSEPPSVTQSPAASVSLSMYSPTGPSSIFAIGPYAHETQLVSPPVFSTFTTEPSTAPFTPPPESVQLTTTTPSSPEVPFAQLLDPRFRNGEPGLTFPSSHYEFQYYQFHPGSPAGQLISPRSGFSSSGTSSPFRDGQFVGAGGFPFMEFRIAEPPNLLSALAKLSPQDLGSRQGSGTLTPNSTRSTSCNFVLNRQSSDIGHMDGERRSSQDPHQRVSFEWAAGDPPRYQEPNGRKPEREEKSHGEAENRVGETLNEEPGKASGKEDGEEEGSTARGRHRTITLGSAKDFDFVDDADREDTQKPNSWWTNGGRVGGKQGESLENWSFFPTIQPGTVS